MLTPTMDPHAWQNVANVKLYVAAIRDGLTSVDPDGRAIYEANAAAYLAKLDALDAEIRALIDSIPKEQPPDHHVARRIPIFRAAYGVDVRGPAGRLDGCRGFGQGRVENHPADQAREGPAVFVENVSDPRLMQRIASETGATLGSRVYSDALSGPGRPGRHLH